MESPGDVGIIIKLRLLNGRPDPGARREMENRVEFFFSKHIRDLFAIPKIDIVQTNVFRDRGNVRALDLRIVKIVEVVEDRDVVTVRE